MWRVAEREIWLSFGSSWQLSQPLGEVTGTWQRNIDRYGYLLVLRRVLRLARMLCALMYGQNGDLAKFARNGPEKKCPRVPV